MLVQRMVFLPYSVNQAQLKKSHTLSQATSLSRPVTFQDKQQEIETEKSRLSTRRALYTIIDRYRKRVRPSTVRHSIGYLSDKLRAMVVTESPIAPIGNQVSRD